MADVPAIEQDLDDALRALADPVRAEQEKKYLKSELEFLGVPLPVIRKEGAHLRRRLEHDDLIALVEALWCEPVFERRMLGVILLAQATDRLGIGDLDLVEGLVRDSVTWALVDPLATDVAGPVIAALTEEDRAEAGTRLDAWAEDENFWVRRTALLAPLRELKAGRGDWAGFARHADAMLEEKEFFVRKAIGWVLRETAKNRPDLVHSWLLPRAGRAAGLSVREAVKYLPEPQRAEILANR